MQPFQSVSRRGIFGFTGAHRRQFISITHQPHQPIVAVTWHCQQRQRNDRRAAQTQKHGQTKEVAGAPNKTNSGTFLAYKVLKQSSGKTLLELIAFAYTHTPASIRFKEERVKKGKRTKTQVLFVPADSCLSHTCILSMSKCQCQLLNKSQQF